MKKCKDCKWFSGCRDTKTGEIEYGCGNPDAGFCDDGEQEACEEYEEYHGNE